jgi:tetratricopeptide (TPR) repeat protein
MHSPLHYTNRFCTVYCGGFLLLTGLPTAALAEQCTKTVATAVSIQGVVEIRSKSSTEWKKITAQDTFCTGDMVRTQANSRVALYLINDSILRLNARSTVTFTDLSPQGENRLDLKKGIAHFISRIKQRFEVVTPYVNAAVDGTEFVVAVDAEQTTAKQTRITVLEGQVRARNDQGEISLTQGETALARAGEAPTLQTRVRPWDAVSWALHYPAVSDFTSLATTSANAELPEPWRAHLAQSLEHYHQGDTSAALTELESLPNDLPNGNLYVYRAALHLAAGQVSHASTDLELALKQNAGQGANNSTGEAIALKTIIAVVQNQTDLALKLAREATEASPDTVGPWLAQSYAQQAVFDLEQARLSVEKAIKSTPESALAWARLAELHLMFGELDPALQAARRAAEIAPQLARTQSVLGFAHLTRIDIAAAEQTFNQAIELDQTDPLPRLGLGLAMIRRGELAFGRRQIEVAASLAPANPLIRSYLGKAYYEEKRGPLDATQFALAKELDPNDPTPWFYDAIRKQTENRPVEALQDLERSTELNDNRAVYRSRLLLDEDQAARSVSQGLIYQNLGFEHLARIESARSLMLDPGNDAAHRLLTDTYVGLPGHEIARVSELLQAQLLQPINVAPISPGAAETNLYSFEGIGPSSASFNEFNSLFNRNRFAFQANGVYGSNDTRGGEIVAAALFNRGSFSAGRFKHRSDGVRENNDRDKTIDNIFAQFRITPKLSVQGEYRNKEQEVGDLNMRFDPDSFSTDLQRMVDEENFRLGLHYKSRPGHSYLLAVNRGRLKDETKVNNFFTRTNDNDGAQYEAQYLWQDTRWRGIAGIGYLDSDDLLTEIRDFSSLGIPSPPPELIDQDIEQSNAYLYNTFTFSSSALLLGASYDSVDQKNGINQDQFNPKLGLSWDIHPRILLRLATFRTLRREFIQNQTLEPTQIAGFNQLFTNQLGTEAWRYGLGLDYVVNTDLKIGVELSKRNVTRFFRKNATIQGENQEENLHRAYLYWTLWQHTALSTEYQFEDFERDFIPGKANPDRPAALTTQRLPIAVHFFHGSGVYARWQTTYVDQVITLVISDAGTKRLQDNFWISDAVLGYRLAKRKGLVELVARNLTGENIRYHSLYPGSGVPLTSPFYPEAAFFMTVQLWL